MDDLEKTITETLLAVSELHDTTLDRLEMLVDRLEILVNKNAEAFKLAGEKFTREIIQAEVERHIKKEKRRAG